MPRWQCRDSWVKEWLREQDWSPQSPDLNLAEILWNVLEKTLHRALTFTGAVQGLGGAVDIICAKSMPQGITVGVLLVSSQPQMNCRMANLCHEEFSGLRPTFMSCYKLQPDKLYTRLKWIRTLSSLSPQFSGIKWCGAADSGTWMSCCPKWRSLSILCFLFTGGGRVDWDIHRWICSGEESTECESEIVDLLVNPRFYPHPEPWAVGRDQKEGECRYKWKKWACWALH